MWLLCQVAAPFGVTVSVWTNAVDANVNEWPCTDGPMPPVQSITLRDRDGGCV